MPIYEVYGKITGLKFLGSFEADTPEAAAKMAANSDSMEAAICDCADVIDEADIEALMVGTESMDLEDGEARH